MRIVGCRQCRFVRRFIRQPGAGLAACLLPLVLRGVPQSAAIQEQVREYNADAAKTILQLQQFRQTESAHISSDGNAGLATLVNLNPNINAWFVLEIGSGGNKSLATYHLENADPHGTRISLNESGLVIAAGDSRITCDVFQRGSEDGLEHARESQRPLYPICGGRVFVRNSTVGHRTAIEAATDFLRDHMWGAENVIAIGHYLLGDSYRESAIVHNTTQPEPTTNTNNIRNRPLPALIDSSYADKSIISNNLGISLLASPANGLTPGAWYEASANAGIYVSLVQPNQLSRQVLESYRTIVSNLDDVESAALCYLIAFDLDRFSLGYALGTEHPRVDWSNHILPQIKDPKLPGPDGIGTIAPLVSTGLLNPEYTRRTVAAFTGGFKRAHGAFKYGEFASVNHGSHYGFIENGVVFSKLQPGLSTLYVLNDDSIWMKTWQQSDNELLNSIRYARQNGVPLIDSPLASEIPTPGPLVGRWGPGNWSGSGEGKLRTIRSGIALQNNNGKRFLIYALFSDATPSAMARVFQGYRCSYAMLLDMNALEHTYLAVYRASGSRTYIDHLLKGMSQFEQAASGQLIPRFIGYPDNRDFFYVMRRDGKDEKQ